MRVARLTLLAFLIGTTGCGYTSKYTPPADGRARALWSEDHITHNLSTFVRSQGCDEAMFWVRHPNEYRDRQIAIAPTVWTPRYYGPDIVVVTPGVVPLLPRPPLFSPSLTLAQAAVQATHGTSGGGGGSGGDRLGKEVLAVLLVIAVVVLPIVDVTVASLRPESDELSAEAIDQVNAYNDLARTGANPCSP